MHIGGHVFSTQAALVYRKGKGGINEVAFSWGSRIRAPSPRLSAAGAGRRRAESRPRLRLGAAFLRRSDRPAFPADLGERSTLAGETAARHGIIHIRL